MELTQNELITLEVFTADAGAFDAVKKVATDYIERQRDLFIRNLSLKKDLSNEDIGAKIRAFDEATALITGIFREIGQYRQEKKEEEVRNSAR